MASGSYTWEEDVLMVELTRSRGVKISQPFEKQAQDLVIKLIIKEKQPLQAAFLVIKAELNNYNSRQNRQAIRFKEDDFDLPELAQEITDHRPYVSPYAPLAPQASASQASAPQTSASQATATRAAPEAGTQHLAPPQPSEGRAAGKRAASGSPGSSSTGDDSPSEHVLQTRSKRPPPKRSG